MKNKKMISVLLVLVATMLIFSGCSRVLPKTKTTAKESKSTEEKSGAYTKQREIDAKEQELFDTVMKGVDSNKTYEAVSVATQVVAGTNYRFAVNSTENGNMTEGYVVIYQPLSGGDAEFVGEE